MTNSRRYSNSYLESHQKCPLRAHYQFDLKLQHREGNEHHLAYGAACHEAWFTLYQTGSVAEAKKVLRAAYPKQLDPDDLGKTADNGCFALECYVKEYNWDKGWKILAMEEMDHGEDDYVVKLDKVVEDTRTGDILGLDHKFTGRYLDANFFGDFNPNSQVTQYYKYIKEKYGRCDGFVIDAVSLRHRSRASTYQGQKQAAGPWVAMERLVLNRTPQQIEQDTISRDDTIADIENCKKLNRYRMHTVSCRFCPYRSVCSAGWDWANDSELILTHFRQACDKWDHEQKFHCRLDLGHEGDHAPEQPEEKTFELQIDA